MNTVSDSISRLNLYTVANPVGYSKIRFIITKLDKTGATMADLGINMGELVLKTAAGGFIQANFSGVVSSDLNPLYYPSTGTKVSIMTSEFSRSQSSIILVMSQGGTDVYTGVGYTYSGSVSTTVVTSSSSSSSSSSSDVYATLVADGFNCASDARLKKDVVVLDGALDKLDAIRGVHYNWIDEKYPQERQVGVIAQEIQAVYPELVREGGNGFLSVDYPKLTAVLIQSIKELKAMVVALSNK